MLLGTCRHLSCLPMLLSQLRPYSAESTTQQHQHGTAAVQSDNSTPVQRLTKQQKEEVKAVLNSCFKQDTTGTAGLLAKSLDDDAKKQLLRALEAALEPPELSRAAMAGGIASELAEQTQQQQQQQQQSTMQAVATPPAAAKEAEVPLPTFQQLLRVGVVKGIPFVAFGFFDNMIMITAGEQIDLMFGAKLGLSSMAAAGLGNTIADVVGINISHTIEQKFKGMQQMAPQLTKVQMKLPQTKRASWLGCALGMAVGCLLGLTPLLFFGEDSHHQQQQKQQKQRELAAAEAGSKQPAASAG